MEADKTEEGNEKWEDEPMKSGLKSYRNWVTATNVLLYKPQQSKNTVEQLD